MQLLETVDKKLQDILIENRAKQALDNVFSVHVLNLCIFHKYIFAYA